MAGLSLKDVRKLIGELKEEDFISLNNVAIGIAPAKSKDEYKLAVRAKDNSPKTQEILKWIYSRVPEGKQNVDFAVVEIYVGFDEK